MMKPRHSKLNLVAQCAAALVLLGIAGCSGQQTPSTTQAAENKVAMNFDLGQCQEVGASLYQCPASAKAMCDQGANRGDIECVKVDDNGVLIRAGR
jgi:hypothetical protein